MAIKAIARHLGILRNTVRSALASDGPPKYRAQVGGPPRSGGGPPPPALTS
jgi:hypothetical protein